MFQEILLYELRYRLKKVSTWVYFGGVFLAAFLAILGAGGVLGGNVVIGDASGKVHLNSPLTIYTLVGFMAYFGMMIISAVMAGGIVRDFQHGAHPFFFTKPISKLAYLGGRFLGSFIILILIFSASGLGIMLATALPLFDQGLVGPFNLMYYLWPYLVSVIPNLFLMGAIFYGLTLLLRKLMPVYVAAAVLFLGYLMASNMMAVIDNRTLAALADPLGMTAGMITAFRFWTIAEKNNRLMPIEGLFLLNRAVWLSLSAAFLAFSFWRFRFSQFAPSVRFGAKAEATGSKEKDLPTVPVKGELSRSFSQADRFRMLLDYSWREFRAVAGNLYFGVILIFGVMFVLVNASNLGRMYDTEVWPVTAMVVENFHGLFTIFVMIILTFFSGEVVWRERDRNSAQILDSMPAPDWLSPASKLLGLSLVMVLLMAVLMATGIVYQAFSGYFRFQPGLYLVDLFVMRLPDFLLLVVLTIFVHVLVDNKYLGHFVMIGYYLNTAFMSQFGLEHNLYQYSSDPGYRYSDMNSYGGFLPGFLSFKLYWAAFAVLLGLAVHLLMVRGTLASFKERLASARDRFTRPVLLTAVISALAFVALGGWIYYNTNILNIYRTSNQQKKLQAEYERLYKKRFQNLPQPRLVDSRVQAELYPSRQAVGLEGRFILKNKTALPIDTLVLTIPREDLVIGKLELDRPWTKTIDDRPHGLMAYALDKALAPGDSARLSFNVSCRVRGFRNKRLNTDLAQNGLFINNKEYLPSIGYQPEAELAEDKDRKRQGLAPKERMAPVDDTLARMNTYLGTDADWIRFSCVVGTDSGQTAIAPGYLDSTWVHGGRRYFSYTMDAPILNFYSFLSGRWQVARDSWSGLPIEVFYHPSHEFNVQRMIDAVKQSLDCYTANFGPYQHRQVRIIEFPRYQAFAQSFPNTIPYSEAVGFVARVKEQKKDEVDYVTSITAHEVAHQWWAHQVIGGNVQGATLMSEVLAEYSSLQVLRLTHSRAAMRKYHRYELDQYLSGRANERKKEVPLWLVENQGYLHYNKGALAMEAIREFIGESKLNSSLASFVRDFKFQPPPFVNSPVFLGYLRNATPDSLQYLVMDLIEDIVIYDNKAISAQAVKQDDGRYRTVVKIVLRKIRADSLGGETVMPIRDYVPVAVLGKGDTVLAERKVLADRDTITVALVTEAQPTKAGIDPDFYLIDRKPEDNLVGIGKSGNGVGKDEGHGSVRIGITTD